MFLFLYFFVSLSGPLVTSPETHSGDNGQGLKLVGPEPGPLAKSKGEGLWHRVGLCATHVDDNSDQQA